MGRNYVLDTEAAKRANTGGKRIETAGAYAGKARKVFYDKNQNGTESVQIMFEADNGQEIGPLPLYTHKKDGTELQGLDAFHAILTCMRQREAKLAPGDVDLYDYDEKAVVNKPKEVYVNLSDKPIGLFLQQEEYENSNGDVKERIVVKGSFEPSTLLMAGEILSKQAEPTAYGKMLAWIEKNPVKHAKARQQTAAHSSFNDSDFDDIPGF